MLPEYDIDQGIRIKQEGTKLCCKIVQLQAPSRLPLNIPPVVVYKSRVFISTFHLFTVS